MRCPSCSHKNPRRSPLCLECGAALSQGPSSHGTKDTIRVPSLAEVLRLELPGYTIERKIGAGGMGTVFLAREHATGAAVAVKALPPSFARKEDSVRRFEREVKALASLRHPNIVRVRKQVRWKDYLFLIMPRAELGSLRDLLRRKGKLEEPTAAELIKQAASGLWAAAQAQIVHRDIKPDNLLLDDQERLMISDFGLAKQSALSELTEEGASLGTAAYMPPEQWDDCRSADHRSDLYALGCTLFELLTGKRPFEGKTTVQLMKQHMMDPPPDLQKLRPDLSSRMVRVVEKLLAKKPEERYQTGHELARELSELAGDSGSAEVTIREQKDYAAMLGELAAVNTPPPPARRVWLGVALAVGSLALIAGGLAVLMWE